MNIARSLGRSFLQAVENSEDLALSTAAQFRLAEMCHFGEGIARDDVWALMWLTIILKKTSAYGFDTKGNALHNLVIEKLTPAEIAKAEELAEKWLKTHAS